MLKACVLLVEKAGITFAQKLGLITASAQVGINSLLNLRVVLFLKTVRQVLRTGSAQPVLTKFHLQNREFYPLSTTPTVATKYLINYYKYLLIGRGL